MVELGPLRFTRHMLSKIWGGRRLERRPGIALRGSEPIGETWELVDRAQENSVVAEGPLAGASLGELMGAHGKAILGDAPASPEGRFPLLVKYIDASDNLSVQVHPDDAAAARIGGGAQGKTEAWFVVDAEPGATLYAGLRAEVTRERFARVASTRAVLESLSRWDARPNTCLLVPGGTVHAIGAGVTILEVQQNSDTTYRLWDWDRLENGAPRATHVAQALSCIDFGAPERPPVPALHAETDQGLSRSPLARSRHFGLNALRARGRQRLATGNQFQIYAVLEGGGVLETESSAFVCELRCGDVWLVPACVGFHWIEPHASEIDLVQLLWRA